MLCQNCGAANNEGANFCQICGQKLQPAPETPVPARVVSEVQPASVAPQRARPVSDNKRKKFFILGGIILSGLVICAIVAAVVAVKVINSSKDNIDNSPATGNVYTVAFVNRNGDEGYGLYLMDSNGQNIRLLVPMSERENILDIAWSPDGKAIAYSVMYREEYSIYVVEVKTGQAARIVSVNNLEYQLWLGFDWAPDGGQIVYSTWAEHGSEIHVVNSDGSQDYLLTLGKYPIWSPDGSYIAFSSVGDIQPDFHHHHNLSIIRPDGSDETILQEYLTRYDGPFGYNPRDWSPDGNWIVTYFDVPYVYPIDIQLVSSDGAEVATIANYPNTSGNCPIFSPDGRWLAFYAEGSSLNTNPRNYIIYIIRTDGSNRQPVSGVYGTFEGHTLSWSPDSRSLIYLNYNQIERVDIYTGQMTILLEQYEDLELPTYEP